MPCFTRSQLKNNAKDVIANCEAASAAQDVLRSSIVYRHPDERVDWAYG